MSIIKGLIDRIIFTMGVLVFMQLPHFVDQYEQRLGGYYQAQLSNLERYQNIANQQHGGNLSALISEFESSKQESVKQAGSNVRDITTQVKQLKTDSEVLADKALILKLSHLVTSVRMDIAQAVVNTYKPAFPLSIEALICGIVGGALLSLLFNACFGFPKLFARKKQASKPRGHSNVKRRVEPTVMRPAKAV